MIQQPKDLTIRVERAFLMNGEPVPVDTVLTLDYAFARELIAAKKAVATDEKPRAPRRKAAPQPQNPPA